MESAMDRIGGVRLRSPTGSESPDKRVCLPHAALARLPSREREIASIVYTFPGMSAKDVEAALPDPMGNSAIRSLLRRLVGKGVLRRALGPGKGFLYSPALLLPEVQERALERVAEDFFDGSLYLASHRLLTLMGRRDPESLMALSTQLKPSAAKRRVAT
jgi:predicted transcriptional regulator